MSAYRARLITLRTKMLASVALAAFPSSAFAQATPAPVGFESGGLTGWTTHGTVELKTTDSVTVETGTTYVTTARETMMAKITPQGSSLYSAAAETALGLSAGSFLAASGATEITNVGILTRSFSLAAGSYSFGWTYAAQDYDPYNDGVYFSLSGNGVSQLNILAANLAAAQPGTVIVGSYGSTPWRVFEFNIASAGTYQLGFGNYNFRDTGYNPILYIDDGIGGLTGGGVVIPPAGGPTNIVATHSVNDVNTGVVNPVFEGGTVLAASAAGATQTVTPNLTVRSENGTFSVDSGVSLTASGNISDAAGMSGAITKTGAGTLVYTGSNTYTGGTNVDAGTLQVGDGTAAATLGGPVTLAGDSSLDLRQNSTISGQVVSTGSGTHAVSIAGALGGAYDGAAGTAVDNLTLASTGSMTSANLGSGNDSFLYQGGTFTGLIDGGANTDTFTSNLGAMGAASISLSNLANFETYTHQAGALTLTGARSGGAGWVLTGGTLTLSGSLTDTGPDANGLPSHGIVVLAANAIVNVTSGAVLNASVQNAIQVGFVDNFTVNNAGTVGGGTGFAGVRLNRSATIYNNAGGIITSSSVAGASGVSNSGAGVVVNNAAGATITGNYAGIDNVQGFEATAPGLVVNNSGAITSFGGYGIVASDGTIGITNSSGGTIGGAAGAMLLSSAGAATLNLQQGSTTSAIVSQGGGARNVVIAGSLTGAYNAASGTGGDSLTLAATGSMTSASLGGGADSFLYLGGAFSGLVDGGTGTDAFTSNLGASGTASISLANLANFETITHLAGTLTLTGASASAGAAIRAGNGTPAGMLIFSGTSGLTGDIYVDDAIIRATTAGAFGTGTIHTIDPTIQYFATGTYANNISLEVPTPASADPTILETNAGTVATLTGSITQGTGAGVDPLQPLTIAGPGTIILTNAANNWLGVTTINSGATLQGASNTISGSNVVNNGTLAFVQDPSGTFTRAISGTGGTTVSGIDSGNTLTLTGGVTNSGGIRILDGSAIALGGVNSATTAPVVQLVGAGASLGVLAGASVTGNQGGIPAVAGLAANVSVDNRGSIIQGSASGFAVSLAAGGTVNNRAGGSIASTGSVGVYNTAGTLILDNAGSIGGAASGAVYTQSGILNLTNQTTGTITGNGSANAVNARGTVTILNSGTISNTTDGVTGVYLASGVLTLTNSGIIDGGFDGVEARGTGTSSVTNTGTITGRRNNGVSLYNGGTIDNQADGIINATFIPGGWGAFTFGQTGTITNAGTINADSGVVIYAGGSLDNSGEINATDTGLLTSGAAAVTLTNSGLIDAGNLGVNFATGGTVSNLASGTIHGDTGGVLSAGALALTSAGTISGGTYAIMSTGAFADSVTLAAGSTTTGDVFTGAGSDTVSAAGGVTGNVGLEDDDDAFTLFTTAGVSGIVDGGAGIDGFTLDGAGSATLDTGRVVNFETRTKTGAGSFTLTGTDAMTTDWTIAQGTLTASGGSSINDAASVSIASGATLTLAANETINGLSGTGMVQLGANRLFVGAGNASSSFGGVAEGAGGLTKVGSGTLTLAGANSYTGGTGVAAGTLRLGASGVLADPGAVVVDAGATLDLAGFEETIGTLEGGGSVTLGSGRLRLGSAGGSSTFAGIVSGAGSLEKIGAGLFTYGNAQLYTGGTVVTAGELRLLGSTASGVTVNGGTFSGTGIVGGPLAIAGGTVSPGVGTISSFQAASLTSSSGAFAVDVSPAQADFLQILGAATLTGGTVQTNFLAPAAQYSFNQYYTIVTSSGRTGTFANPVGFVAAGTGGGLFQRLRYDLVVNGVVLEIRRTIDFSAMAETPNQQAVADALETTQMGADDAFANLLNRFSLLSAAQQPAALDSLSGEGAGNSATVSGLVADRFIDLIEDRLDGTDRSLGMQNDPSFGAQSAGVSREMASLAGALSLAPSARADGSGAWAKAYGFDTNLDGRPGQADLDADGRGLALGFDVAAGDAVLGAAVGFADFNAETAALATSSNGTAWQGGIYGRLRRGGSFAGLAASYVQADVATSRRVAVGALAGTARGETDVRILSAELAAGHDFQVSPTAQLGFVGTVRVAEVRQDAYSETGGGVFNLDYDRQTRQYGVGTVLARAANDFTIGGNLRLNANARAGISFAEGDLSTALRSTFAGAPAGTGASSTFGAELPSAWGVVGAGLNLSAPGEAWEWSLRYEGRYGRRLAENQLSLGVNVRW